jgi:hypothetical protein
MKDLKSGSVTHQMVVPVPSISCSTFNNHNLFYHEQNALAFNRDRCCHLVLSLQLMSFHCYYNLILPSNTTHHVHSKLPPYVIFNLLPSLNIRIIDELSLQQTVYFLFNYLSILQCCHKFKKKRTVKLKTFNHGHLGFVGCI